MIKINVATNTRDTNGNAGLPVASGILLNINPHFSDRVEMIGEVPTTIYSVSFDAVPYKDMAAYNAKDVLINSDMFEYPIGYTVDSYNPQALTSIDDLLDIYRTAIENGAVTNRGSYAGVGVGNTELIYPTV